MGVYRDNAWTIGDRNQSLGGHSQAGACAARSLTWASRRQALMVAILPVKTAWDLPDLP